MKSFALWTIRFRRAILWTVALLTLLMAYFLKDLEINADVMSYLPEDDPAAALFNRIGDTYGGNEMAIVGLSGKPVFEAEMLELVRQVTDSIRTVPGIGYVTSLTNVLDIRGSEWGIEMGRLVDEFDIPRDPEVLDSLRTYTLSREMYRRNLVSEDAMATLVIGKILTGYNRAGVVEQIQEKLAHLPFEGEIYFGGMPVTLLELSRIIVHDVQIIAPLTLLIISLILLAGFRSGRGVVLPLLTVIIAATWTMGVISLLGYQINMLTNIIPVILLAVGSAYAIHVVNAVVAGHQEDPEGGLQRAIAYITVPVALASLTTIFGFLSFIAGSYLVMIREFGFFSALGIFFSLTLAVTFVPAALATTRQRKAQRLPPAKPRNNQAFDLLPGKLSTLVFRRQRALFAAWGVLIVLSLVGMSRIERRVDIMDYFQRDSTVRKAEDLLNRQFHGSSPLYLQVRGDIQSPATLSLMEEAQDFMAGFDYIPYSQSVADLVRQMNDVMGEGEVIPDDPVKIVQLWFLLDGQEIMEQLVSADLGEGIIQAYVTSSELDVLREIETRFDHFVATHRSDELELAVTGTPIMLRRLDKSIINSQTYSLVIAMMLVMVMTGLLLRSFRLGALAVIPIAVTLVVLFGTMGLTGVPLDIATVLAGSVTIGIGIDYAIHFISRYAESQRMQQTQEESLARAIRISGKAIFINMVAVSAGFATLTLSRLVPLQRFGFLIAVTMITAGMATLTLLPLLLKKTKPFGPAHKGPVNG